MKTPWKVGDDWLTPHNHVFKVKEVYPDGKALLQMISPMVCRPVAQKPKPAGWKKIDRCKFTGAPPMHHLNCTYILPSPPRPSKAKSEIKWYRERTHGCWCSSWRQLANGEYRIWRRGAWRKPKPGELRRSSRWPRFKTI